MQDTADFCCQHFKRALLVWRQPFVVRAILESSLDVLLNPGLFVERAVPLAALLKGAFYAVLVCALVHVWFSDEGDGGGVRPRAPGEIGLLGIGLGPLSVFLHA